LAPCQPSCGVLKLGPPQCCGWLPGALAMFWNPPLRACDLFLGGERTAFFR
jgi:hypothetical protein